MVSWYPVQWGVSRGRVQRYSTGALGGNIFDPGSEGKEGRRTRGFWDNEYDERDRNEYRHTKLSQRASGSRICSFRPRMKRHKSGNDWYCVIPG